MKIVVVGVGRTGELLVRMLSGRQHELVVVDEKEQVVDRMTELYPVSGVCGNGVAGETLRKAGVDTADVVAALTNQDAANLLCCANAKKMGAGHVICQVSDAALYQDKEMLKRQYGINAIYNPKIETAAAIGRSLVLPFATAIFTKRSSPLISCLPSLSVSRSLLAINANTSSNKGLSTE